MKHDPICWQDTEDLEDGRCLLCALILRARQDERYVAAERVAALPPDSSRSNGAGIGGLLNGVASVTRAETFTYYIQQYGARGPLSDPPSLGEYVVVTYADAKKWHDDDVAAAQREAANQGYLNGVATSHAAAVARREEELNAEWAAAMDAATAQAEQRGYQQGITAVVTWANEQQPSEEGRNTG